MNVNVYDSDSDEEIRYRLRNFRRVKIFKQRLVSKVLYRMFSI